eukprot:TRINITY_DN12267_c0_g1_i1.p1 TRINITY_DN12267_c0_g1~~TRINITY_DN12267_c0_g1_i1.p1  ORF type:complete len:497 (+),score=105.98 TRINITY_DN12267_c0_g1_i1:70-1560(+)
MGKRLLSVPFGTKLFALNVWVLFLLTIGLVTADRYLEFLPIWKTSVYPNSSVSSWQSCCFQSNQAEFTTFDSEGAKVTIDVSKPSSELCGDLYLIATAQAFRVKEVFTRGRHEFEIRDWREGELDYVRQYGLQLFLVQGNAIGFLEDLVATYEMFFSKKNSMEDAVKFLKDYMNITLAPRANGVPEKVIPDVSEVLSGDCLQLFKFGYLHGGINAVEAYGTGGRADHVAALLSVEGEMYVVESMGGGDGPEGIIKTPYQQWMQELDPSFMVALLRLSEEYQSKFNQTAAEEFFLSVEGMPYGYHNYFFGWVDTPSDNYPPPLSAPLVPVLFAIMDKVDYNISKKMWGDALNMRMNTTGLTVDQVINLCEEKNISFYDVITWPEQDSWTYSDGKSLVCSSFVMAMYKAAGVFGDIDFQATELTPRDSYSLNIYAGQGEWTQPSVCNQDPFNSQNGGYCQFSGAYVFDLPDFDTISPFNDMFQKCGGLPVDYIRAPGC